MKTKLIKLNNGGELLYSPRKNAKAISVVFYFKAGAINDPSNKKGLAHFCEHAVFSFSTNNLDREQRLIIKQNLTINGATSLNRMIFYGVCVQEELEQMVDFFVDAFCNLKFEKDDFEKEKQIIVDEIKTRRKTNLAESFYSTLPKIIKDKRGKAYSNSAAGDESSVQKIKPQDLKEFMEKFLTLNNLCMAVSGNVSKKDLKMIINKVSTMPSSQLKGLSVDDLEGINKPFFDFVSAVEKKQDLVTLYYKINPEIVGDELAQDKQLKILRTTLSKMLFEFFREKKNFCYSANASYDRISNINFLKMSLPTQTENTKKLLECYSEFLQNLTKENLQEKFEIAKKNKINFTNFDVLQILDLSIINIENFVNYKKLGGDKLNKETEDVYKSVQFEKIYDMIKQTLSSKPYLSIVSNDETFKDFDYKNFCKKLKINLE